MRTRALSFLLVFPLLFSALFLVSCRKSETPYQKLLSFGEKYPLPAGKIYDSTASEGEENTLDPLLLAALFGDGTDEREDIVSFALFLGSSLSDPYEMGIVLAPDPEAARELCGLFTHRLNILSASPYVSEDAKAGAFIRQYGRWAVYAMLPDNPKAERVLDSLF